jgi:tryptophan synthase alpha chain
MNRIERKFRQLKKDKKKAFIAFITAGYPGLSATEKLVYEFSKTGVDIIELGVPFSDPIADGPVIQESSFEALRKGVNLGRILKLVKKIRKKTDIPICLMTYYNPVYCFGEERFLKEAVFSGVDGVIIPDLPPEEGLEFSRKAKKLDIDVIFLLSPTSTEKRSRLVSSASRGFIYYVSLTGVTGARKKLPSDLKKHILKIKGRTDKSVCVGFGVSTREQIRQICQVADGVIVGSAIVKKIKENINKPDLVKRVKVFVKGLTGHV